MTTFDLKQNIESLKNQCNILELDIAIEKTQLVGIDGLLIFNDNEQEFSEVCELILKIKSYSNCLVWVISKENNNMANIVYLRLGVDGNFNNQHSLDEFQLQITNTLNRMNMKNGGNGQTKIESPLSYNSETKEAEGVVLDVYNRAVVIDGNQHIGLTILEYKILQMLMDNTGKTITYKEMYENVWSKPYNNSKYRIANVIYHLRVKLERDSLYPDHIETIRSIGYRFVK